MSQSPPPRPGRPDGASARGGGAPARSGPPVRGRAPVPRPKVSAATYWRRRIVVLGAGAGVLTTLTWAVNGLLVAGPAAGHTVGGTSALRHTTARHHAQHASPVASPSATASHAPAHHRHRGKAAVPASGSTPACASGDVTLTVSSAQGWYQPGATPRFTVRAVSTATQPCHFDMGPRAVAVVIDSSGGKPVWNSADCASGSASHVVVLASGTHASLHVSWNRRTGCGDAGSPVDTGEYNATAAAGDDHSKSVNFVLGAKGVSGP